jgi:hypothetical protein
MPEMGEIYFQAFSGESLGGYIVTEEECHDRYQNRPDHE